jgi:endonuclease/exonuclease/phosphatase family metal-dependent hydrolase
MVRLVTADAPDLVCLQEVPVWALSHLAGWSGMTARGDVTRRQPLSPLPLTAELGRVITDLNNGLFRSALTGQANAVLVDRRFTVLEHRHVVLNPFRFRRAQAKRLGLDRAARLAWAVERRVCQAVRVGDGERTFVLGNLHATGYADRRLADAELLRAAVFVDGMASPDESLLMCGDFNVTVHASRTLGELMTDEWGFAGATPKGIDHVLVRGLHASEPRVWPVNHRLRDGKLLSDHAPVELDVQ